MRDELSIPAYTFEVYVPRPPLRAKYPVDEALEPLLQRRFCNACGKEDAKLMCGRCRIVRYCSEDCRQQVARLTRLAISESMWIHIVACL
mmetsp:Transcript_61511/g.199070  ORF Transcript_61511/g.199070 Transcript_61511/m.199070 type:complete len:90 (+) Transcript_61511:33-302(+)